MSSVKEQTLSGVKWSAIGNFSVKGVQFVLGLLLARLLVPSDFGTVGMIGIFFAISNIFIDSGFWNALVQKNNCTEDDYCTVFYFTIFAALFFAGLLCVIAPWVADFFNTPILCPILRVQTLNMIIGSTSTVQTAKMTIALDFKALAKRRFFASVISGIIGVCLAYLGFGVWSLVLQGVALTIINTVFVWIYCRWIPASFFSRKSFGELFGYGSKLMASGILNTIYNEMTTLVIGKFYSAKDLGYYNRGTNLATYPVNNINGVLQGVTFPILAKIKDDDLRLIGVYRKYICITSMCIFFVCTLFAAIGKPLVLFLLTEKWSQAIIYLQVFSFAIMFDHICSLNLNLLQVKGRSDLFLKLEVIKKTVSIGILIAAVPFGVTAICISKIIYTQIALFINTYYTGKMFHLGYVEQIKDFGGYLIKSLLACVPAFAFTFLNVYPVIMLAVGCCSSLGIYYFLLGRDPYLNDLLDIFGKKIKFVNKLKRRI